MAEGQFWTINIWDLRAGQPGRELEELTRNGIIPDYSLVPGVLSVKLFRVEENDDVGKYMAVTVYESRTAYNNFWNSASPKLVEWNNKSKFTLDRWLDIASPSRKHGMQLLVEDNFGPGTKKMTL